MTTVNPNQQKSTSDIRQEIEEIFGELEKLKNHAASLHAELGETLDKINTKEALEKIALYEE